MSRFGKITSKFKNLSAALLIVLWQTAFMLTPFIFSHRASAVRPIDDNVTICHRSNSATNPYQVITVDPDSIDGDNGNDNGQGDHFLEHVGPLASSLEVANQLKEDKIEWGDIIPPIEGVHSGLNWTEAGQAMWNNDCSFVEEEEEPEPGTIIIEKETDPDGSNEQFTFNPSWDDGNFNLKDGDNEETELEADTYSVEELEELGWTLTDIDCGDADVEVNLEERTVTINLGEGETVTCTFVNTEDEEELEEEKITICHATASRTNPYVVITVDISAADGIAGNSGGSADHFGEHTGPLFPSDNWGDIIPPIEGVHSGLNWTEEGQAIFENDCEFPEEEEETGSLQVNKLLDSDGDGEFDDGGNEEANRIGFRWSLDDGTFTNEMGTTVSDLSAGEHAVDENDGIVAGFSFTGWFFTGSEESSCENPDGTTLPIDVTIVTDQTTRITLCNAAQPQELQHRLFISKFNDTPNAVAVGHTVTYTLVINVPLDSGDIFDTFVVDLPPENFQYNGNWTASSNNPLHDVAADVASTGGPSYASPGVWFIGDLIPGETITLTYQTVIQNNVTPGEYPDIAYAYGLTSTEQTIFASCVGNCVAGQDDDEFVGTDVSVLRPSFGGQVLGANTLVNTGEAIAMYRIFIAALMLISVALLNWRPIAIRLPKWSAGK